DTVAGSGPLLVCPACNCLTPGRSDWRDHVTLQTRCADSLRELAADPIYHNRAEDLEGLANAVADEDDDSWTGIDLIGAFPPHATVSVGHKVAVERVLGVLAGVSVFLPVGWTWWSLQRASSAYSE